VIALLMGLRTISPEDLDTLVRRHAVVTIDVNARTSWLSARVPGALTLDPQSYSRKAPTAARRAKGFGYRDVRVMSAGITGWLDAALPTESGSP